jgi:starch phosphorylase
MSAEFLIGPQLGNNLINLGIFDNARQAMQELGLDLDMLLDQEEEPGLGNGGLGRLAACYLDSLATLEIPAIGYGIRYEFGIFTQAIRDGQQVELTDKWLRAGSPWLIHRPNVAFEIKLGGHTEHQYEASANRRLRVQWVPAKVVRGTAWDMPVLGYGVNTPNRLRLWSAEAPEAFDFAASMPAITIRRSMPRFARRRSPRSCIRTTKRKRARSCGSSSSISSFPARCRT